MLSGVVMVVLAAASWGTWSLFLRPTGLPAHVTSPIIFAVMALVAWPLSLREKPVAKWDRSTVRLLVANSICDALNVVTFFAAIHTTTVAIAVVTHYLAPILVALAAPRIDGGSARTRGAPLAAVAALAGLAMMLEPWRDAGPGALAGAALGLASAICYMGNVFIVRRLGERIGPARAMSYHSCFAALGMLPFAVSGFATVTWFDLGLLTAGAASIGALSGIAFIIGLQRIGAARAAVLTFAEPLVAVLVGVVVWHEPLRPLAMIGGAVVLAAGIGVAKNAEQL